MASKPEFEPGPHWWGASALTTAPPLLRLGEESPRIKLLFINPRASWQSRVAQMNLMLAWYCFIEDVTNILEKVKISKNNFGGLLLFYFSIFVHAVTT